MSLLDLQLLGGCDARDQEGDQEPENGAEREKAALEPEDVLVHTHLDWIPGSSSYGRRDPSFAQIGVNGRKMSGP